MKYLTRSSWTAQPPKSNTGADNLVGLPNFRTPVGIAVHSLNDNLVYVNEDPYNLLKRQQSLDYSKKGLGDIAYNFAVPSNIEGFYCLRGIISKSAAQEEPKHNNDYLSLLCLMGNTEEPTDQLLLNLGDCVTYIQTKYPGATRLVPYSALKKSSFQGERLTDAVNGNDFNNGKIAHRYFPDTFLKAGDYNVHVFDLIEALAFYGYYQSRNDGMYGVLCTKAVKDLQQDLADKDQYPRAVDGIYGRWTRDGWNLSLGA